MFKVEKWYRRKTVRLFRARSWRVKMLAISASILQAAPLPSARNTMFSRKERVGNSATVVSFAGSSVSRAVVTVSVVADADEQAVISAANVIAGSGLAQCWGGTIEQIRPGDVIWFPPGEKHWHGAAATTAMTHIAIQERLDGKTADWMEKVSDEQYG